MSFALLSRFLTNKPPGKFLPLKLRFTFFKAIFRKIKIYTYVDTETAYKIVQYFAEQCKGPQVPALGLISLVHGRNQKRKSKNPEILFMWEQSRKASEIRIFQKSESELVLKRWVRKEIGRRTFLVVQWLRLHFPVQGLQVWSLVGKLRSHMPWVQLSSAQFSSVAQ